MYNVACVKWGTKFNADYVNKLYAGVKRNTTVDFNFYCFTEDSDGLHPDIIPHDFLMPELQGWWQKLSLFCSEKEMGIEGRMLFLDLDTLITGNIDHYIKQDSGFVILRDLWAGGDNVGSAIISFEIGKHTKIWDSFKSNPAGAIQLVHPHGDQKWIQKMERNRIYWQDKFPNEIVSFKSGCRQGLPKTAKIVCYHGKPSILESINETTIVQKFVIPPTPWVRDYWRTDDLP